MKQFFSFIAIWLFAVNAFSQNIGIGTMAPLYKLDVRGSINTDSLYRIAGDVVLSINGSGNIFAGVRSGIANTTGYANTGIGNGSLSSNTSGFGSVACGSASLGTNSSGSLNTAIGANALLNNTSGGSNTASGALSLLSNITGDFNCATGSQALISNTTGSNSCAFGANSLYSNNNSFNTGFGVLTLRNTRNAQFNTAIGYAAGDGFDNGYNNVFVGANTDVNGAGLFNVIAMGQGTIVTSGSSTARFGNSATVSYGGWAGWSNVSDGRFKMNVKENVPGIEFIKRLRPITYNLDATTLDVFLRKNNKDEISEMANQMHEKALSDKEKIIYTGFVAQEVEAAAKQLGFDFSGIDAPKNADDTYGLRYAEFVVPLVKAVQELSKQNEELQKLNSAQKQLNEELIKRIEKLESINAQK